MTDQIVQAGNVTLVSKITYGTPLRAAVISSSADIDAIVGLSTTGAVDGSLFVYDSDAGEWRASSILNNQIIDGRVYPSDSDRAQILIRRSGTQGDPLVLRTGELAYSWLQDSGSPVDGFGNGGDRLFIGVGAETDSNGVTYAERIEVIGGKYFTDLLNHAHGTLTASSALIVDSAKRIDEFYADAIFIDSASITRLYISDSATAQDLKVTNLFIANDILATGTSTFNTINVNRLSTFDSAVTIDAALSVTETLNVTGLTTLDSANINRLQVDSSLSILGDLSISGATTFDSSATFNGDIFVGDRVLREFIDSSVFNLLIGGQSITLTYNDSANTLTVDADVATVSLPGVASFDSSQFSITGAGQVSVIELNGGTY